MSNAIASYFGVAVLDRSLSVINWRKGLAGGSAVETRFRVQGFFRQPVEVDSEDEAPACQPAWAAAVFVLGSQMPLF